MDTNTSTKRSGVVQTWFVHRRYGFIVVPPPPGSIKQEKFYFHASRVQSGIPYPGAKVLFDVNPFKEGEYPGAINVEVIEGESR